MELSHREDMRPQMKLIKWNSQDKQLCPVLSWRPVLVFYRTGQDRTGSKIEKLSCPAGQDRTGHRTTGKSCPDDSLWSEMSANSNDHTMFSRSLLITSNVNLPVRILATNFPFSNIQRSTRSLLALSFSGTLFTRKSFSLTFCSFEWTRNRGCLSPMGEHHGISLCLGKCLDIGEESSGWNGIPADSRRTSMEPQSVRRFLILFWRYSLPIVGKMLSVKIRHSAGRFHDSLWRSSQWCIESVVFERFSSIRSRFRWTDSLMPTGSSHRVHPLSVNPHLTSGSASTVEWMWTRHS